MRPFQRQRVVVQPDIDGGGTVHAAAAVVLQLAGELWQRQRADTIPM
jgi:hypothetical protein